jgi:hypothetical protein
LGGRLRLPNGDRRLLLLIRGVVDLGDRLV